MSVLFIASTVAILAILRSIQYLFINVFIPWLKIRKIPSMPIVTRSPKDSAFSIFPIFYSADKVAAVMDTLKETFQESDLPLRKTFFFGRWLVQVQDPLIARQILGASMDSVRKLSFGLFPFENLLQSEIGTENLVFSNDDSWKKMRRIIQPVFRQDWDTQSFARLANKMFAYWEQKYDCNGQNITVNIPDWMQRITLDALGKFVFDYDFEAIEKGNTSESVAKYNTMMPIIQGYRGMFIPSSPIFRVIPFVEKFRKLVSDFNATLQSIIQDKLNDPCGNDILSLLIRNGRSDEADNLSLKELSSNAFIFFIAGHDTTSNSLASTLYYLAKYPDIQEKLYAEISSLMGEYDLDVAPSHDELSKLKYLECVLMESARCNPPINSIPFRLTTKDITVGNDENATVIPEGTLVSLQINEIHHSGGYWEDPWVFKPERFLAKNNLLDLKNPALLTFGYGPRSCIGKTMSLIEQRVFITMITRRYQLKLAPNAFFKGDKNNIPTKGPFVLNQVKDFDLIMVPRNIGHKPCQNEVETFFKSPKRNSVEEKPASFFIG